MSFASSSETLPMRLTLPMCTVSTQSIDGTSEQTSTPPSASLPLPLMTVLQRLCRSTRPPDYQGTYESCIASHPRLQRRPIPAETQSVLKDKDKEKQQEDDIRICFRCYVPWLISPATGGMPKPYPHPGRTIEYPAAKSPLNPRVPRPRSRPLGPSLWPLSCWSEGKTMGVWDRSRSGSSTLGPRTVGSGQDTHAHNHVTRGTGTRDVGWASTGLCEPKERARREEARVSARRRRTACRAGVMRRCRCQTGRGSGVVIDIGKSHRKR
jgi:hypothetical protein